MTELAAMAAYRALLVPLRIFTKDRFDAMDFVKDAPKAVSAKKGIMDIAAYVGGRSKLDGIEKPIKLSSNENALGCSPKALEAYQTTASTLFRYPDGHASHLRDAVAHHHDLEPERLIFGNGSDEVFSLLNQTLLEPGDNIVTGEHGFLAYRISALACQSDVKLAREPERRINMDALLEQVDDRTKIVYVSNPANPTGTWNSDEEIAYLHQSLPAHIVLVIDEAYAEYVTKPDWKSAFARARAASNIVVTRTFSKIYGLAGLRLGFGYAPVALIEAMDRIRLPFNVNLAAQMAGIAALNDQEHLDASCELVRLWMPRLVQMVSGHGFGVSASAGNFFLVDAHDEGQCNALNAHLMAHGIIVRHVANYGLPTCLRITIGDDEANEALINAFAAWAPKTL